MGVFAGIVFLVVLFAAAGLVAGAARQMARPIRTVQPRRFLAQVPGLAESRSS